MFGYLPPQQPLPQPPQPPLPQQPLLHLHSVQVHAPPLQQAQLVAQAQALHPLPQQERASFAGATGAALRTASTKPRTKVVIVVSLFRCVRGHGGS